MNTATGNYRWRILGLLFLATTINYIDRQVIGILKPFIAEDLGWSEADYGYIVTAFQIAYAIGLLTTGHLIDRLGVRISYLWAIIIWSVAGMVHSIAKGVASFSVARFMLGIGESANFPAAVKSVAEWFPKKERAFATGLFNSGSTVGAIIAPIIVSVITVSLGWRWAFIITGGIGFVWVILWLSHYYGPGEHPKLSKKELNFIIQDRNENTRDTVMKWSELFKYKETVTIGITRFISDWVWWFFLFWIPDFLNKTHGVNIKEVVLPLIIIYAVSSIGGISGGWISSKLISIGKSIGFARKSAILICAIIVLPVILVPKIDNLWITIVLIALAAAGHQGWASNIFTLVSDIYPSKAVGSMTGLVGFMGAVGGALSASFVGLLLETTGSYFFIFMIAASVYLINWFIISIVIREVKPIKI